MSKNRRKFSPEERLSILQECDREGQAVTCRKYSVSPSLVQRWKAKYLSQGMQGLQRSYHRVDPDKRAMEEEIERLKKIIVNQALELEFKTELLKHATVDPSKKKRL
jgi:transposase-like protein